MTDKRHELDISCEEYAALKAHWGEWKERQEPFYIYLHCGARLKVQPEHHSEAGFGYDRMDALADIGISDAELDAQETARNIAERLCDHFSIRQLQHIIPALQAQYEEQEARRQWAISHSNNKPST